VYLVKDLTLEQLWGTLLGEVKNAIERAIGTNAHEGLLSDLEDPKGLRIGDGGGDSSPPTRCPRWVSTSISLLC